MTSAGCPADGALNTSALLAFEPEAEGFRAAVEADATRLVSAATLLETALVIEARKGEPGGRELDLLIHKADVVVVPVDAEHVSEKGLPTVRQGTSRRWPQFRRCFRLRSPW
jgi:ribonuclease VapC